MMVNLERGFKRIAWIISAIILVILVAGFVEGMVFSAKLDKTKRLFASLDNDPDFLELSEGAQNGVRDTLKKAIRKYTISREEGFSIAGIGFALFAGVWIVFFLARWIVKGFSGRD